MGKGAALDWWLLWLGVVALVLVGLLQGAGDILGELGLNLWTWGQTTFRPWSTTLQALALPALVWLAFTYLLKEVFPRPQPVSRAVVSVVTAFWGVRYLLWRLVATLNLENPVAATVSLALFGAEALTLLNAVLFYLHHIFQVNRSREADRWSRAVLEGTYLPWVDVLIPTYNEDVTILRRTVIGCQAMDYPHKRVYLLDDGRRPEVK
ncbi:MAG: glycosyltransferase family 2 protein, partial [Gloeomargarita sp. GMQP_bins_25]